MLVWVILIILALSLIFPPPSQAPSTFNWWNDMKHGLQHDLHVAGRHLRHTGRDLRGLGKFMLPIFINSQQSAMVSGYGREGLATGAMGPVWDGDGDKVSPITGKIKKYR